MLIFINKLLKESKNIELPKEFKDEVLKELNKENKDIESIPMIKCKIENNYLQIKFIEIPEIIEKECQVDKFVVFVLYNQQKEKILQIDMIQKDKDYKYLVTFMEEEEVQYLKEIIYYCQSIMEDLNKFSDIEKFPPLKPKIINKEVIKSENFESYESIFQVLQY